MFKRTPIALLCATLPFSYMAHASDPDARADAMGGTATAIGHYYSASLHNPALLSSYQGDDDFAISLNLGASVLGEESLIDDMEDFTDAYDAFIESGSYDANLQQAAENALEILDDRSVNVKVGASLVVTIPNKYASTAIFAKTSGGVTAISDLVTEDWAELYNNGEDPESEVIFLGDMVTDIGVTVAKSFDLEVKGVPGQLNVGFSPKVQQVDLYNFSATAFKADDIEEDDITSDENMTDDSGFNMDFGAMLSYEQWRVALAVNNMISNDIDTVTNRSGGHYTYEIKPMVTLGGGYYGRLITAGLDLDLTEESGFSGIDGSQYLRLGAEFNAYDWAQLRIGYNYDMNDVVDGQLTAGIGLSPFDVLHFNLSGAYSEDSSASFAVQLALTF